MWEIKQINREDFSGKNNPVSIRLINEEYNDTEAYIKWDGCIEFRKYWNGYIPDDEYSKEKEENCDYIHICDIDEMILKLQELKRIAKEYFSEDNYNSYWKSKSE